MTLLYFLVGVLCGALLLRFYFRQKLGTLQALSDTIIQQADTRAKNTFQSRETSLKQHEKELLLLQEKLKKEQDAIKLESKRLEAVEKQLKIDSQALVKHDKELARIAELSKEEARAELFSQEKRAIEKQSFQLILDTKEHAEEEATKILLAALGRLSAPQIPEAGRTAVELPSKDLKSKIVGKDGRNLRAFEELSGVTLLIDELPNCVILSCFDPERRFIAERALHLLLNDGRINPERIQESLSTLQASLETELYEVGKKAAEAALVYDLAPKLLTLLGKLHLRTSFTQNVLAHSIEVSRLMGLIAAELKLDESLARRIGLLHDIGKALPAESQHSHAITGAHFAKLHGEKERVTNGIACHHEEVAPLSFEAALCKPADTLSATRSGARFQPQKLERQYEIEKVARTFPGVEEAYALQAGRELRVIVSPDRVNDQEAELLLQELSSKLDTETAFPNKIKITLVREKKLVKL